jgi:uncharacterized membrane protein
MSAPSLPKMLNLPMPPPLWIILAPIFVLAALSLLMPLLAKDQKTPPDEGWRGVFYANPKDPSLFVRKRFGIGYTLNFSNPWSWVVLAIIFAMVAAPLTASVLVLRKVPK